MENKQQSNQFILQSNTIHPLTNLQLKTHFSSSQIYKKHFFDHFHVNYYGRLETNDCFLISIRTIANETKISDDHQLIHAIIRLANKDNFNICEQINITDEEHLLTILLNKIDSCRIEDYELIHHINANKLILEYDQFDQQEFQHKISFIYQHSNQNDENDILNNNEMSTKMEDFLQLISQRIQLKDFAEYRGDLDTQNDEHGIYSYFSQYEDHQLMFNVCPLIFSAINNHENLLRRKSLIGNSLICLVFQDEGAKFNPEYLSSKVIQVYIVIQPIEINCQLQYQIEIWRRSDIQQIENPFGQFIQIENDFRKNFLEFLLNTNQLILQKEFFQQRISKQLKNDLLIKLCQKFHFYSKQSLLLINNQNDENRKHHRFSHLPKFLNSKVKRNSSLPPTEKHQN